ncbi:MAG TPA: hypothetical protein VNM14_11070 [Planctomycetota bacterium]|nr:hypothetical protein [Planctomycetota bacterium]
MRRIVQPYRILFVDRALGWSFLFLAASLGLLLLGAMAAERQSDPTSRPLSLLSFAGFGALFLASLWCLFRKRAFIVDVQDKSLTVLEGRLLRNRLKRHPLDQVSVKLERKLLQNGSARSGPYALAVGRIFLRIHDHKDILFLDDLRGPEAETLATQLANDLNRPLTQVDRDHW